MRKRGLIVFAACLPIWATTAWLNWQNEKPPTIDGWILFNEPSDFKEGASWAALIGAALVVSLLFVDFVKWILGTAKS